MRRYQVEYRNTPAAEPDESADVVLSWMRCDRMWLESESDITIEGLDVGRTYDVRIRLIDDETGAESPWSLWPGVVIERDGRAPPAPTQVRTTKDNCLTWEMPMEVLNLRGFRVRHATGADECWERAEPAHEGLVDGPPFVLCRVPKGRRSFMVKAVTWDGWESESPAVLIADRGPVDDKAEFDVGETSQITFPGTIAGGAASGGVLVADSIGGDVGSQPMFGVGVEPWIPVDGASPMIPLDPEAEMFAPVWGGHTEWISRRGTDTLFGTTAYRWMEYVWTHTVATGQDGPRAVMSVDVAVVATTYGHEMPWRLQYRRPSSALWIPIDPWGEMIPTSGSAEMLPTESMREWRPWPGRLLGVEAGAYEFRLLVPGGHQRARVTRLSVSVSSEPRVRHVTGLSVPALGGTRVPPGEAWREIVEARVLPISGTPTNIPVLDKARAKGPALTAVQGDAAATALVDVVLRGR